MVRLFNEHTVRRTELLSGAWKIKFDKDKVGGKQKWFRKFPDESDNIIVPSCWNNEFGKFEYEGDVWYSRKFTTYSKDFRIIFEAVMTEATVYIDGKKEAYHYGGFTAFEIIKTDFPIGVHTITLKVNNEFDEDSIPHKHVDWYHYGGITRDVVLEELKGVCILNQFVDYKLSKNLKSAKLTFNFTLRNFGEDKDENVNITVGEKEVYKDKISIKAGETKEIKANAEVKNIKLWDVLNANLYYIAYKTETDDLYDRIGFREIKVDGKDILLNGKKVQFRGVNRHEDHPDFGMAFPRKMMKRDIEIIRSLNCNAIRGAHYPNAKTFLDYLDEYGIMFWSEIPIWGVGIPKEDLARPLFIERGLTMHTEMIAQYRNHPSIVLWGMHNEIESASENGRELSRIFYEKIKSTDASRPVIFASRLPGIDICYDYCDVIGWNLYYGWYGSDGLAGWELNMPRFKKHQKDMGAENKPVIMSEFGGAALYGVSDFEGEMWTEEFQENMLKYELNMFLNDKDMSGTFIWQYCDIRTAKENGMSRARGFNNKGLLNEHRKPKRSYYAVRDIYKQFEDKEK